MRVLSMASVVGGRVWQAVAKRIGQKVINKMELFVAVFEAEHVKEFAIFVWEIVFVDSL